MFCWTNIVVQIILVVIFCNFVRSDSYYSDEYEEEYNDVQDDARLNTFSLIKKYGYPCEIHRVYTEDNYLLEMHRIPGNSSAPVVFLQHGLLSSSAEWVLMTPGRGLAYLLADAGYDVWMGNARGNTYSRSHATIKPTSSLYWKFSWHEIGYYDLPAMIDYVIAETGVPKIQYIGFSQGTTVFWVLMSMRPEYNDKIIAMQALAPVAYLGNVKSPLIRFLGTFTNSLELAFKLLGTNEILPNGKLNEIAGQSLCIEEAVTQAICTNLLFLICGFNAEQLNTTMLPVVMGHTPAGASTRQLIHFGQLYKKGTFEQFDYGWLRNKRIYGTYKPPSYKLSAIRTPVFLHYADNDWLSTPTDVMKLAKQIPSAVGIHRVPMAKFNHLDFVFAINATELIYNRLINIMRFFMNESK
ncbi:unnamed protein product [Chrysodeixis includens]|uniref:Lipase n=1 Tax=Chrysodeixis includens TaxID=689277 RepID=A0A9P0BUC3_CHRIL|nr:unnamed protein product [Chrysodeixis includens]